MEQQRQTINKAYRISFPTSELLCIYSVYMCACICMYVCMYVCTRVCLLVTVILYFPQLRCPAPRHPPTVLASDSMTRVLKAISPSFHVYSKIIVDQLSFILSQTPTVSSFAIVNFQNIAGNIASRVQFNLGKIN